MECSFSIWIRFAGIDDRRGARKLDNNTSSVAGLGVFTSMGIFRLVGSVKLLLFPYTSVPNSHESSSAMAFTVQYNGSGSNLQSLLCGLSRRSRLLSVFVACCAYYT